MNVSIGVLAFPEDKKNKLKEHGFLFVDDLLKSDAQKLMKGLDEEDINQFHTKPIIQSALEVWKNEVSRRHISTFSSELDTLLGGGVEVRSITDLCGAPGTGKTQICLQLCIDTQLPEHLGGINGQALFIDTNYGFTKGRLQELAERCVDRCGRLQTQQGALGAVPSVAQLLGGVHVLSTPAGTLEELLAALASLRPTLLSQPQVRLIVVDSFSKPFLLYYEDTKKRTAMIYEVLSSLQQLAWEFNLAVVTTSQVTTAVRTEGESSVVPGLGQGLAHRVTHRVMLGLMQHAFHPRHAAQILKSPSLPRHSAFFKFES